MDILQLWYLPVVQQVIDGVDIVRHVAAWVGKRCPLPPPSTEAGGRAVPEVRRAGDGPLLATSCNTRESGLLLKVALKLKGGSFLLVNNKQCDSHGI